MYRDPEAARDQMRSMAAAVDPAQVEMLLRREPKRFDTLRIVKESRALGLITAHAD